MGPWFPLATSKAWAKDQQRCVNRWKGCGMSSYQLLVIQGVISWRLSRCSYVWPLRSWLIYIICVKTCYSNTRVSLNVAPFEGTMSTSFSWHLTDRKHLADIPRYTTCEEKRAQVWMERNNGKIFMTFRHVLCSQNPRCLFSCSVVQICVSALCFWHGSSNPCLNLRYCVKKAELQQDNLACLQRICLPSCSFFIFFQLYDAFEVELSSSIAPPD